MAAVVLALGVPATASAVTYTATVTLAPIGTGSYLLTVTNTGVEMPLGFAAIATGGSKNVVSDAGCSGTVLNDSITCVNALGVGAVVHACYSGSPVTSVLPGAYPPEIAVTSAPATTCPLAGFTPAVPVTPAPATPTTPAPVTPAPVTPTTPATAPVKAPVKAVHTWKRALCVSTFKSWKSRHKHATAKQRRSERTKLKTQHGCKASALK